MLCQQRSGFSYSDWICPVTTDDLAAQMVREMLSEIEKQGAILVNYAPILEPIARRYIEKALTAQAEEIERLRKAVEPFIRHGRALGVYDGTDGPFWIMTDSGYRAVPAEDFRAALKAAQEVGRE